MVPAYKFLVLVQCLLSATHVRGSNPKRGLPVVQNSESDLGKANGGQCSWFYNWSPTPPTSAPLWGRDNVAGFTDTVHRVGAKTILSFNEPDMTSQSNISPGEAAQLWQQHIQPLKSDGVRLGSPAISSGPNGLPWLAAFIKACNECTIDFIAVHWYGEGADNFSKYLAGVHTQFPKPIWVTEFAETSRNAEAVATFMAEALEYLDAQWWIEHYSWFAYAVHLVDGSGNLNTLGASYVEGSRRGYA
ncbi:hypothetical protein FB451DRAFT_1338348 [Mycena latifolia]|nr:hypothetical protein FB451DRAFT_1338348 [Mycena latifolia]